MALSNIQKEPRREITEQIAGVVAVALFIWADYTVVQLIWEPSDEIERVVARMLVVGFVAPILAFLVLGFLFMFTHWVGEGVCALLAKAGWDPRPTQRY